MLGEGQDQRPWALSGAVFRFFHPCAFISQTAATTILVEFLHPPILVSPLLFNAVQLVLMP